MLAHVVPFALVLSRVVGIMVFAPLISMASIPLRVRAALAFVLALSIYPVLPAHAGEVPDLDLWSMMPAVFGEVLVGAVLGMLASVPLLAMEMAGQIVGHQMGLSLARAFNPTFESQMDVVGQLMFTLAAGVYLAMGGIEVVYLTLARTFESIPTGRIVSAGASMETYIALARSGTELALRVAAPVMGTLVLILIAMGFLMKTMPQINILSFGFAVKILAGLVILTWSLFVIEDALSSQIQSMFDAIGAFAAGGG